MGDGATRSDEGGLDEGVAEFLVALGIAAQRIALYPEGHPLVAGLGASLEARASRGLTGRGGELVLSVAGPDLLVNEMLVQGRSPHLRELARRLRERQLGVVTILEGVRSGELHGLCRALAQEAEPGDPPLPPPEDSRHIRYHPMEFDRLILDSDRQEQGLTRAGLLWLELARTAMGVEENDPRAEDPSEVARAIRTGVAGGRRNRELVGQLRRLVTELLETDDSPPIREVERRLQVLLDELDEPVLRELMDSSRNSGEPRRLVQEASRHLGTETFLKLLRAAAPERGRVLSPALVRTLSKLALHAREGVPGVRRAADAAVQEAVGQLVEGNRLEDPSPARYAAILEGMAREARGVGTGLLRERPLDAWIRTVEMAVEVGAWGPMVSDAVDRILEAGEVARLVSLLNGGSPRNEVLAHLEERVVRPEAILGLATVEGVPEGILEGLIARLGVRAVDPLLDALALTDFRSTRRTLLAALESLGEPAARRALERLDDPRWYVLRNRLAIARGLDSIPVDFDPTPHLHHADHRVRVEALALAVRIPGRRVSALGRALRDPDARVVARGLRELPDDVPAGLLHALEGILESDHPPDLRLMAMRGVARSSAPEALDLVVARVSRRGFLGRLRLRPTSPVVLEGIRGLATRWSGAPRAESVLKLARRSRDGSVRQCATGGG